MKTIAALSVVALALVACQNPEASKGAGAGDAPAGSAEAVQRILALPVMERCGSDWPGHPAPTANQVVDLGGGAFAVLTDCYPSEEGQAPWKTLHVQGADGVLKAQPLILYNGPEYEDGYDWEVSQTSQARWDAAAKEFVWSDTLTSDNAGVPKTQVRTMRWRWDGSKIVMVSAVRVTPATLSAPPTGQVTGWPAPGETDPTPAATLVPTQG
ncbi:hypothetical protein [Brevundimonas sp. NIBR11]|uniref:hypothetical protein n=1 Tax=Brevundimonas sp. NIBR11 TaxID=3015999 RepID=UPI0022F0B23C|nr:hypothetical protein [Brevundimonas sp. NIBR11]WGM31238.1 hypothetical protein KKHFBJBL_01482 [Brevundimonas sp. NIBR11]